MKSSFFSKALIRFVLFTVVLATLHYFLLKNALAPAYTRVQPWKIYFFLVPIQLAAMVFIHWRYSKSKTDAMNAFMLVTTVKIVGSILFLSPWLFYKTSETLPFIYQFFALFFPFLMAETVFAVKMLNREDEPNEQTQQ